MTVEAPFQDPDDPGYGDDADELTDQTFWTIEDLGGELWQLGIYDVDVAGREVLIAGLPLNPDDAVQLSDALSEAHREMTGEPIAPPPTDGEPFRWNDRSTWSTNRVFQLAALALVGGLVAVLLIINLIEKF